MKKFLFSLILLLVSYVGFSQKGLSYQAVILDPAKIEIPGQDISSQPLVNGDVWLKFSIFNGSTLQFEEVHKTKTDNYGLVNLLIGSVSATSFNSLVWDSSQKSLQVFVSFNQGGSYTKISDQKLNYNPYALFAETAGKLSGVLPVANGGTGATTAADARANLGLDQVNNTSDAAKPVSTATQNALNLKANTTDLIAGLAGKADTTTIKTFVVTQVASATISDADATTKGKIKLAGDLAGTADSPTVPGLALKANAADVTAALDLKANATDVTTALASKANGANVSASLNLKENTANKSLNVNTDGASDLKYPSVKAVKTYVDAQVTAGVSSATIADASPSSKGKVQLAGDLGGTAAIPTVPGLALKAPIASPTFTGTVSTGTLSSTNISALTYASTPRELTYTGSAINWTPAQGLNAAITLTQNSDLNFTSSPPVGSYGTIVLTQDATGNRTITLPSIPNVSNKVLGSTSTSTVALSTAANSKDILNFYYDGTNCYWNIGQGYGAAATAPSSTANLASGVTGTLPIANGGTGATTASAALTSLGAAPIASPTFTGTVSTGALSSTSITAPTYASTPITLTYTGSNINWNPAQGLNAAITLTQNSGLNFTAAPPVGSYGTVVLTQDVTGSRTITLPTIAGATNKVLGSTSTSTVALSTVANSKDILNFYYDGTNCYWNIGQGYGAAAAAASSTANLASGVTGTLPIANGGTGATTLTGLVKGNGTGAMTAAVAGTDYQAPLTLTTTGTGAATLSGTTLNIPTPASGSSSAAVFLPTIVIGTQQWSRLNLDVVTYRNGDIIPQVTDEATWNSLTTGAWCYYNNDPANGAIYGKLYNWYAVNDPRGLAPTGWHIPTNAEWGILIDKLNSYSGNLDKKLKTVGSIWSNNIGATNESGFSGLPGGTRAGGSFSRLGLIGMWWSSGTCAYSYLEYTMSGLSRSGSNSEFGISVRCVRD